MAPSTDPPASHTVEVRIFEFDSQKGGYPVELHCDDGSRAKGLLAKHQPDPPENEPFDPGTALFQWLFADPELSHFWTELRGRYPKRRVRLHIDSAADLHHQPWELLRDSMAENDWAALAAQDSTPFSRYRQGRSPGAILEVPLRVLVAIADPENLSREGEFPISRDEEWNAFQESLAGIGPGLFEIERLEDICTLKAIERKLRTKPGYHVLHLIGHGGSKGDNAFLLLADGDNQVKRTRDIDVQTMFRNLLGDGAPENPLRMVFLCCCQSASLAGTTGLAPKLLEAGIATVVAMHGKVPVSTARQFSQTFYQELLAHGELDLACNRARATLQTTRIRGAEIPVLYSRLLDGKLFAEPPTARTLRGRVVIRQHERCDPVQEAPVTLEPTGATSRSNADGVFTLPLPRDLLEGEEIRIGVAFSGYAVSQPVDGRTRIPRQLRKDTVVFELLPKGSPKFYSHEYLCDLLQRTAQRSTEQVHEQREKKSPDLTRYLEEWATEHGFTVLEIKQEIDRWAGEVEKRHDNIHELGLAAFARMNFADAGKLFEESARRNEQNTVRDYRLAGDAFSNDYDFRKAEQMYHKAFSLLVKEEAPQLWAATVVDRGLARWELGIRTGAEESASCFESARKDFERALTVFTREQFPRDWAGTQNKLGIALRDQARRSEGPLRAKFLEEALSIHRCVWEVCTRAQFLQDAAEAQHGLGTVLWCLAERSEGARAAEYLEQAIAAFRSALEVRTRERFPLDWARTQTNLGHALIDLAQWSERTLASGYLEEAAGVFHGTLAVYSRDVLTEDWARTQSNLGAAWIHMAEHADGDVAASHLQNAVAAIRAVLEVATRERLPQSWAIAQGNLGLALMKLAPLLEGVHAVSHLEEAITALRCALEVTTREHLPQDWARHQRNLGRALAGLAGRSGSTGRLSHLEGAAAAFRHAAEVYTYEDSPHDWAGVQNDLGNTLLELATDSETAAQAAVCLEDAAAAYRNALLAGTRDRGPMEWARTQSSLGEALRSLARHKTGASAAKCLEDSIAAQRSALEVFNREQFPAIWVATQTLLADSLSRLARCRESAQAVKTE